MWATLIIIFLPLDIPNSFLFFSLSIVILNFSKSSPFGMVIIFSGFIFSFSITNFLTLSETVVYLSTRDDVHESIILWLFLCISFILIEEITFAPVPMAASLPIIFAWKR